MQNKQMIPDGWKIKKLGDIFSLSAGGDVDKSLFSEKQDKVHPYPIYANALTNQGLYGYSSDYRVGQESITITGRGDIGKVFYRKGKYTPIVRLVVGIPKDNISAKYMAYACSKIRFFNETTGVPQLTVPQVSWYKVAVPPLAEQEKIAQILATWDTAIEQLTYLIAEKQKQKKALMQRLLTRQQRLPEFNKPWKNVKLGDVCSINKGKQLSRIDMLEAGYPVYNGGVSESGYTNTFNTEADTIIISEGGNSCGFVNFIKTQFWAGGHCYVLFEIQPNKNFFYQLLKFYEQNIMELRVGSGLPNIQTSSLKNLKLFCPIDISEQRAIADILMTADAEIDLLKRQLDAITEQKHGLMQKLLTGQIRVKVDKKG